MKGFRWCLLGIAVAVLPSVRAAAQVMERSDTVIVPTAIPTAPPASDTLYEMYDEPVVSLPLALGLRVPSYDRVNGVSLPWGPRIRVPGGRVVLDPIVTYRSNLGDFDPAFNAVARFGRHDALDLYAGRGTFTNDSWIRSDILNSLAALGVGSDARNYYRADRFTARLSHSIASGPTTAVLSLGGLRDRDWSTGIHERHTTAPWSFFYRTDSLKMRRINPEIARGRITSALAGIAGTYSQAELKAAFRADLEHAFDGPRLGALGKARFTQLTLDGRADFPTFGKQSFGFNGHALVGNDRVPPQRFAYLGGAGTLATVDLLALGGDKLFFVAGEYRFPLRKPNLPLVGPPILSARYAAGSAGVGELPSLIQNIGAAIGVSLIKLEYHIDPNFRKTPFTHKHAISLGFSLNQ